MTYSPTSDVSESPSATAIISRFGPRDQGDIELGVATDDFAISRLFIDGFREADLDFIGVSN